VNGLKPMLLVVCALTVCVLGCGGVDKKPNAKPVANPGKARTTVERVDYMCKRLSESPGLGKTVMFIKGLGKVGLKGDAPSESVEKALATLTQIAEKPDGDDFPNELPPKVRAAVDLAIQQLGGDAAPQGGADEG